MWNMFKLHASYGKQAWIVSFFMEKTTWRWKGYRDFYMGKSNHNFEDETILNHSYELKEENSWMCTTKKNGRL